MSAQQDALRKALEDKLSEIHKAICDDEGMKALDLISEAKEALAATAEPEQLVLPRSDSEEAKDAIFKVFEERNYPCSPAAAARCGFEAAVRKLSAPPQAQGKEPAVTLPKEDAKEREWSAMPEWISVERQMPEEFIDVLVAGPIEGDPEKGFWQNVLAWTPNGWALEAGETALWGGYEPMYWKPLPAAPSPENKHE